MLATLLLSAALVSQAKAQPQPPMPTVKSDSATPKPASALKPQDPILAQLREAIETPIDPKLPKRERDKLKKRQAKARSLYSKRVQALAAQAEYARQQAEYERLLPLMLKQQELEARQAQTNALIRSAAANESNARANARNAEINRQRLLREQYPQFYGR